MNLKEWEPKREWMRWGNGFLVSVRHHINEPSDFTGYDEGPHRWNVYAWIYPSHKIFSSFKKVSRGGSWPDVCHSFPLHGGVSYFCRYTMDNRKVSSYKLGSDYNHLYDNRFTHMETPEEAQQVFADAEELYNWLNTH